MTVSWASPSTSIPRWALRATLEQGTTPELEALITAAPVLITSRLSLVESAHALLRIRQQGRAAEEYVADTQRDLDALWARCNLWELSRAVCDLAANVVPGRGLRTLDALHLATFLLARRRIGAHELLIKWFAWRAREGYRPPWRCASNDRRAGHT